MPGSQPRPSIPAQRRHPRGLGRPGDLRSADVVVITARARQRPGQSRVDLARSNIQMLRELIPALLNVAPNALFLIVTNPVDVLTYAALKISALPRNRILGSGTVLDSSRFRYLIARGCKVAVQSVHAYIAGEHGDSAVPLWSSASIANIPLHTWSVPTHSQA